MVTAMRPTWLLLLCCLGLALRAPAQTAPLTASWDRVALAPTKTSIYFGSVTLTTADFARAGSTLTSTYAAKVFPWIFWSESGRITINFSDADLARMSRGETAEFTGEAVNQKNKRRQVTGRAQPADASSGKIKVRIAADGIELIFNSTYRYLK